MRSERGYFVCSISGSSMLPLINDGEIILFEKSNIVEKGDIVLYRSWNNKKVCHRVMKIYKGNVLTKGDNCKYNDLLITKENILGRAVNLKYQKYKKVLTILSKMNILKLTNKGGILWKKENGKNQ